MLSVSRALLRSLDTLSSSCSQPTTPSWTRCVAALRALHSAAATAVVHHQHTSPASHLSVPELSIPGRVQSYSCHTSRSPDVLGQQVQGRQTANCLNSATAGAGQQCSTCNSNNVIGSSSSSSSGIHQRWTGTSAALNTQQVRLFAAQAPCSTPSQQHPQTHQQQDNHTHTSTKEHLDHQQQQHDEGQQQQQQQQQSDSQTRDEGWGALHSHFRSLRQHASNRTRPEHSLQQQVQELKARQQQQQQEQQDYALPQQLQGLIEEQQQQQQHHHHAAAQKQQPVPLEMLVKQQQQQQQQQLHRPARRQQQQQVDLQGLVQPLHQQRQQQQQQRGPQQQQQQQQPALKELFRQQQQQQQCFRGGGSLQDVQMDESLDRLHPSLAKRLLEMGVASPTPVQVEAFPAVLSGRNVSIQSPTGSGKTLSYLNPLIQKLYPWGEAGYVRCKSPRVVVVCPTRELCVQVMKAARDLLPQSPTAVYRIVGGSSIAQASKDLRREGPLIITATPGRLASMMEHKRIIRQPTQRPEAGQITHDSVTLVLEEADRLVAMEDFNNLLPHLSLLHQNQRGGQPTTPNQHMRSILGAYQVILVSASLRGSLASAQSWLDQNPITINSGAPVGRTPAARAAAAAAAAAAVPGVAAAGGHPATEGRSAYWAHMLPDTITHQVMALKDSKGHPSMRDTLRQLKQLLRVYVGEGHKVLLFVRPGQDPVKMHERLQDIMGDSCKLGVLSGSQGDQQRSKTLAGFNSGALQVLLTSDAFGLGLDYKGVDVVICLDDPTPSPATYVARAGRTGRMGRPGVVVSLVTPDDIRRFMRHAKKVAGGVQEVTLAQTPLGKFVVDVKV